MKALLVLEDGKIFACRSFTGHGETWGELVFNTSMTGYQEVLTDPSYREQMVVMTYPLIGNYGVNSEDVESDRIQVAAFLMREYQQFPNNYRSMATLADYLKSYGILGLEELDTRALTRHIRTRGAMRAIASTQDLDPESLLKRVQKTPDMKGRDLASVVTTQKPYRWVEKKPVALDPSLPLTNSVWQYRKKKKSVLAFDYGIKYNILRHLESAGCEVIVIPGNTDSKTVKAMAPDGIFISNGPGDPEPLKYAVKTLQELLDYRPIFGICLGIQLMGLALGATTFKLKFGHRGANQPVKNLITGRVEITSQNHGFAVDVRSLNEGEVEVTHINLNDNTLEGFRHRKLPLFAVQYHPEASPGPHDASYLFDEFKRLMA
ncbi:MAG: glutamine-hydrolyzing carbamoyl-phosphate synthase small subunit [Desulfobacterales bacterium]